jgi:hypothetical protein
MLAISLVTSLAFPFFSSLVFKVHLEISYSLCSLEIQCGCVVNLDEMLKIVFVNALGVQIIVTDRLFFCFVVYHSLSQHGGYSNRSSL